MTDITKKYLFKYGNQKITSGDILEFCKILMLINAMFYTYYWYAVWNAKP